MRFGVVLLFCCNLSISKPLICPDSSALERLVEDSYLTNVEIEPPRQSAFPRTKRPYKPWDFRRGALIGGGGESAVYLGSGPRPVVIKELRFQSNEGPLAFDSRHFEAPALARSQPNPGRRFIAEPLALEGNQYVEEYVGQNLRSQKAIFAQKGFSAQLKVATELGLALAAAHDVSVVHADVKPDNVLLNSDGEVRLSDWGNAGINHALFRGGGTWNYSSPWLNAAYDPRQDVYGAGATLGELVYGAPLKLPAGATNDCCVKRKGVPGFYASLKEAPFTLLKRSNAATDPKLEILSTLSLLATTQSIPFADGTQWSAALQQASAYQSDIPGFYGKVVQPLLQKIPPEEIAQMIAKDPSGMQTRFRDNSLGLVGTNREAVIRALRRLYRESENVSEIPLEPEAPSLFFDRGFLGRTLQGI